MSRFIPAAGDLVWLEFTPQTGHDQAGRRPALCISAKAYNRKTGLGLFCPLTSREKGYPFEVACQTASVRGVILADQVKSLDWRARRVQKIGPAPEFVLEETLAKMKALLPVGD